MRVDFDHESHCVPRGTRVFTPESIRTVPTATRVLSHNGQFEKVVEHGSREYDGKIVEIDVKYTNFPMKLTPNHGVLVVQDVREPQSTWKKNFEPHPTWIPAKDLTKKDFVSFPRISEVQDMGLLNEDLAEILGWYVAEGDINQAETGVRFSLGKHEKENISRLEELLKNTFGKVSGGVERTKYSIVLYRKSLIPLFKEFGVGARNKNIPEWFLYLPHHKQYKFLKGLCLGDGTVADKSVQVSGTVSEKLAFRIRLVLFRLGLLHSLRKDKVNNDEIERRKVNASKWLYTLNLGGDSARTFAEETNIDYDGGNTTTGGHGYIGKDYAYLPISGTRKVDYDKEKVFNLQANPSESYVLPQGTVHNCIYKHLTCSSCNLFEDISKEERRMSNEENGKLENDEIGHNFHKAFGWMVGAVSHATESEDSFLSGLADDLRVIYQLLSQAMEAERKKSIKMKKKAITAQGRILKRLTEHYKVEEGGEK